MQNLSTVSQFWLTLNPFNWFKSVKLSNNAPGTFDSLFDGIVPSLARIQTKQHGIRGGGEYLFQNVARRHGPQELVPWCEFQSRLLFIIICLLLKTFWQPCSQVQYMLVLDVCTTAFWIRKNIHSCWVLMKLFLIFFSKFSLGAEALSLNGFFTDFKGIISWR